MKKIAKALVLAAGLLAAAESQAVYWMQNGLVYSNICRSGAYYTIYPVSMGQAVGTSCPVRDSNGNIFLWGTVSLN